MTESVIILMINFFTSFLKRWIVPKWGKGGVQGVVFILALIGALYSTYGVQFASVQEIVVEAIGIFSLAITFYEVILKKINVFKGE